MSAKMDLLAVARKVGRSLSRRTTGKPCGARVTITRVTDDGTVVTWEFAPEALTIEVRRDPLDITRTDDEGEGRLFKPGPLGFYLVAACRPGALVDPVARTVTPATAQAGA